MAGLESGAAVKIETSAVDSKEVRQLMAELWREVDLIYGNSEPTAPDMSGLDSDRAAFLIVRVDGKAMGCVGLRPLSDTIAEVKRMYVQPAARRTGLARRLMERLEAIARENGFAKSGWRPGCGSRRRSGCTKISATSASPALAITRKIPSASATENGWPERSCRLLQSGGLGVEPLQLEQHAAAMLVMLPRS